MKITIEYYNNVYTVELPEDINSIDLLDALKRLMVQMTYHHSILDEEDK